MQKTDRVQRLKMLARRAGDIEFYAYVAFNRKRAYHFMRKMNRLTQAAIKAQQEAM